VAAQAAIQLGARHGRVGVLANDPQQIVERQQQAAAQFIPPASPASTEPRDFQRLMAPGSTPNSRANSATDLSDCWM
jgi:uncharacterized protein (DUF1800 family)